MSDTSATGRTTKFLILGGRGFGKTSTIRKLAGVTREFARDSVIATITLVQAPDCAERLVANAIRELKQELQAQSSLSSKILSAFRAISGVTVGPLSLTFRDIGRVDDAQGMWRTFLSRLSGTRLLFLAIDNCELMDERSLEVLKMMAEWRPPFPMVLVISGASPFDELMHSPRWSHVSRSFSSHRYDLGEFTEVDTDEALRLPIATNGLRQTWTTGAVSLIHIWTLGQPYLVQCFGRGTFDESVPVLDEGLVQARLVESLGIASDYLTASCERLSNKRVNQLRRWADTGKRRLNREQLRALGFGAQDLSALAERAVLRRLAAGSFELAITPAAIYKAIMVRGLAGGP